MVNKIPMIPPCHNRPEFKPQWVRAGYKRGKILLRLIPHTMSQECKSYDGPEGSVPDPIRFKWNCEGCRWLTSRMQNISRLLLPETMN